MIDCNDCLWLNITEDEQRRLTTNQAHRCLSYSEEIKHYSQDKECYFLFPCERCDKENYRRYAKRINDDVNY